MRFTKETLRRTLRTLLQTAISYICVNIVVVDWSADRAALKSAVIGIAVSALAAGIAAVMNLEKKEDAEQ